MLETLAALHKEAEAVLAYGAVARTVGGGYHGQYLVGAVGKLAAHQRVGGILERELVAAVLVALLHLGPELHRAPVVAYIAAGGEILHLEVHNLGTVEIAGAVLIAGVDNLAQQARIGPEAVGLGLEHAYQHLVAGVGAREAPARLGGRVVLEQSELYLAPQLLVGLELAQLRGVRGSHIFKIHLRRKPLHRAVWQHGTRVGLVAAAQRYAVLRNFHAHMARTQHTWCLHRALLLVQRCRQRRHHHRVVADAVVAVFQMLYAAVEQRVESLVEQGLAGARTRQRRVAVEPRAVHSVAGEPVAVGYVQLQRYGRQHVLQVVEIGGALGLRQLVDAMAGIAHVYLELFHEGAAERLYGPGVEAPLHHGVVYAAKRLLYQFGLEAEDGHHGGELQFRVVEIAALAQLFHEAHHVCLVAVGAEHGDGAQIRLDALGRGRQYGLHARACGAAAVAHELAVLKQHEGHIAQCGEHGPEGAGVAGHACFGKEVGHVARDRLEHGEHPSGTLLALFGTRSLEFGHPGDDATHEPLQHRRKLRGGKQVVERQELQRVLVVVADYHEIAVGKALEAATHFLPLHQARFLVVKTEQDAIVVGELIRAVGTLRQTRHPEIVRLMAPVAVAI